MAKSGYKFIFVSKNDLYLYIKKIIPKKKITIKKRGNTRSCMINKWNINIKHYIHQGKYWRLLYPNYLYINYRLGMFSQTRKPFFYRSKKKKR